MASFNRGGKSDRGPKTFSQKRFGAKSFGGGNRGSDDRDSSRPSMHDATCSSCGKDCQVPFRPTGSRPIFCSICFDKQGGGSSEKFGEKSFDRPRFGDKRKREFERDNTIAETKNAEHLKAEFARLHAKLDMLLQALEVHTMSKRQEAEAQAEAGEETEKAPFKMKKKVATVKKTTKKK